MFQRRVRFGVAVMLALAFLLLARLVYLQVLNHEHFTTLSQENRLKIMPIAPTRGLIFSRSGAVLAENRPAFFLTLIPENANNVSGSLDRLRKLLNLSRDELESFSGQLKRARRFERVTLKNDMSIEEVSVFSANRHLFPGFRIQASVTRHYPLGKVMAHVIGYVGRISATDLDIIDGTNYSVTTHIGKSGVERARESVLHGKVGYQRVEVNAQGRILRVVERVPPVPGKDIYLTVDADLQKEAIEALRGRNGAIVVIDTASGGVIASVSVPSFDPNEFVGGISSSLYESWSNSRERPLFNRALQGQYPPGSTVKPILALAGLNYGVRRPDEKIWCHGWFSLPADDHRYRDWIKDGHGQVDLRNSIARSCDVYFYKLAHDLGIQRLHDALSKFGFGTATGVDIPGEAAGLVPSPAWKLRTHGTPWYTGETVIVGIGQGFLLATPLQLAYVTAIIANRGEVSIPHFVAQIGEPGDAGQAFPSAHHRPRVELSNQRYWDMIIDAMVEVVHGQGGTARRSGTGSPVRFAGKTGTSQVFTVPQGVEIDEEDIPTHLKDHGLFIAYAPVDAPEIAIAIVIENGGSGSAAPVARRLIDQYFEKNPQGVRAGG